MRPLRFWVLVAVPAFVLLAFAALQAVLSFRPIHRGMSEEEAIRVLGPPFSIDGGLREDVLTFREGSEWTGYRVTWASFIEDGTGNMPLYQWGTRLTPPDWLSRLLDSTP